MASLTSAQENHAAQTCSSSPAMFLYCDSHDHSRSTRKCPKGIGSLGILVQSIASRCQVSPDHRGRGLDYQCLQQDGRYGHPGLTVKIETTSPREHTHFSYLGITTKNCHWTLRLNQCQKNEYRNTLSELLGTLPCQKDYVTGFVENQWCSF